MNRNNRTERKNWNMVEEYGFKFHMKNYKAIAELHDLCRRMQSMMI